MENIEQANGVREFSTPDHLDSQSKVSTHQDKGNSSTPNTHWYF